MFCIFYLLTGVKYKIRRGEKGFGKLIIAKHKILSFCLEESFKNIQVRTSLLVMCTIYIYIYRERERERERERHYTLYPKIARPPCIWLNLNYE